MNRKEFKRKMRALNKVAAENLNSPKSARQFLRSASIMLRDQSETTSRMTVVSTSSADGWMIITTGDRG